MVIMKRRNDSGDAEWRRADCHGHRRAKFRPQSRRGRIRFGVFDDLTESVEQKNRAHRKKELRCRIHGKKAPHVLPRRASRSTYGGEGLITKMVTSCMEHMIRKVALLISYVCCITHLFQALHMLQTRVHLGIYYRIPFNFVSRVWGTVHSVDLPVCFRSPAFRLYVWLFQCDLEAAVIQNLREYRNLSEFFRRKLRPELRPINPYSDLTSPADGRILHLGRVESGHLEQVKGVKFTMQDFLGPKPNNQAVSSFSEAVDEHGRPIGRVVLDRCYQESIKHHKDTELFHCIIYLSPGDYHCFHSPADWDVEHRRHFPGRLMSVRPSFVRLVRGLFAINERAIYFGKWRYGFFSMTLVGATNVGSIRVLQDEELQTNVRAKSKTNAQFADKTFAPESFTARKGELFGEFNFGSTVVLIFEAPPSFMFAHRPNDRIQYGQTLSHLMLDV